MYVNSSWNKNTHAASAAWKIRMHRPSKPYRLASQGGVRNGRGKLELRTKFKIQKNWKMLICG